MNKQKVIFNNKYNDTIVTCDILTYPLSCMISTATLYFYITHIKYTIILMVL